MLNDEALYALLTAGRFREVDTYLSALDGEALHDALFAVIDAGYERDDIDQDALTNLLMMYKHDIGAVLNEHLA